LYLLSVWGHNFLDMFEFKTAGIGANMRCLEYCDTAEETLDPQDLNHYSESWASSDYCHDR
jgi:hypothetical protein